MIAAASLSHRAHPVRQFVRFLVVGAGNTLLSFVAYRLLLEIGTPYAVAAPVAFGVGALNGYIFNRRWTFAAQDSARARVLYVSIAAAGAICDDRPRPALRRGRRTSTGCWPTCWPSSP